MKQKELNTRQRKYCQERVKGKNQKEAYKAAGYGKNSTDKTNREMACRLEKLPKIQKELARLTKQAESGAILDRNQRQAILSEMALNENMKDDNRQRAIDMLNRMAGDYTEHSITEIAASVELSYEDKKAAVLNALMNE